MALRWVVLALCALSVAGDADPLGSILSGLNNNGGGGSDGNALGDLLGNFLGGMADKDKPLCQPGQKPAPKMDHHEKMSANGCGPQGLQIKETYGLHKCCNGHDVCFSVCGTSHEFCEKEFRKCMKKICKKPLDGSPKECKAQAKAFSSLTQSMGKGFHSKSQEVSCDCLKGDAVPGRHREYLQSFFQRYNESQASDEVVDDALTRWKGKEAHLYFDLVKTYGRNFVRFDDIEAEFLMDEL